MITDITAAYVLSAVPEPYMLERMLTYVSFQLPHQFITLEGIPTQPP